MILFLFLFYFFQLVLHATFVIVYTFSKVVFSNLLFTIFCSLLSTNSFTHTHTHTHTQTHTHAHQKKKKKLTLTSRCYGPSDHCPPILPTSSSLKPDSFYTLNRSFLHPSVSFSVINITLWSLLFDELPADIRSSISHTSFHPSHITLLLQPPARFNLCYQRTFLLSKCLFLQPAHNSMVPFL